MPFVGYVHAEPPGQGHEGRPAWEPNWRLWRWIGLAVLAGYGAARAEGGVELVLMLVVFGLVCRAALEALPDGGGLREHRQ
jgi:hypothetical protein